SLRLLSVSLGVVGALFAALGSPVGAALLVIGALGAAIYLATTRSIRLGTVLDWLRDTLHPLAETVREVFGVIHDSLLAGEWAAAARVLWAAVLLAFAHGSAKVQSMWIGLKTALASAFIDLAAEIESVWQAMTERIVSMLVEA